MSQSFDEKIPRKIRKGPFGDLAAAAVAAGWTITTRQNGHLKWTSPDGATVFSSLTPSRQSAALSLRRDLRHNGLDV